MSKDTRSAETYIPEEQYEEWVRRADALDMSLSEYIKYTVEAGHKQWQATVEPDTTNTELREQRNALQRELERARERIESLEDRVTDTSYHQIIEHVRENPGATWKEIQRVVGDSVSDRVTRHLNSMEGDVLTRENGGYYIKSEEHE